MNQSMMRARIARQLEAESQDRWAQWEAENDRMDRQYGPKIQCDAHGCDAEFTERRRGVTQWVLAERHGWREIHESIVCPECYRTVPHSKFA